MIKKPYHYYGLALLGHIIIFMCFSLLLTTPQVFDKNEFSHSIPAYISHITPTLSSAQKQKTIQRISKLSIEKSIKQPVSSTHQTKSLNLSLPRAPKKQIELTPEKNINKPLLKILHDATAAHLVYPAIAIELKQRGTVTVTFFIQPDGEISKVSLLKSSGSDILDNAAIEAITAMSPVDNVRPYLFERKYLAVDVVFR